MLSGERLVDGSVPSRHISPAASATPCWPNASKTFIASLVSQHCLSILYRARFNLSYFTDVLDPFHRFYWGSGRRIDGDMRGTMHDED